MSTKRGDFGIRKLACNELLPSLVSLLDDGQRELLVLGLAVEGEGILRVTSWDLVNAEPLIGGLRGCATE